MNQNLVDLAEAQNVGQNRPTRPERRGHGTYSSILETIGNTPVVRLARLGPPNVELYAKLEAFNPMGSVKDRLALAVIEDAERSGRLKPGQTVIEATSGNTGIGLAMVCARKGYPLVIVMAENFSLERRKLLRFLGAKLILTPAAQRGTGMFRVAEKLAKEHGWFLCRQFENEANAKVHIATTAHEILQDFGPDGLDYWVTGFGTGGTLKGVATHLKSESPTTKVVVAEPDNAQLLSSDIPQPRRADGAASRSHPNSRAHPMQGWTPDFVPKLAEDARELGYVDAFQPVRGVDALATSRALALKEGILSGISGGATVAAAIELAKSVPDGSRILAMVPDTGERYLSTPLFEQVPVDMTDEEQAILASAGDVERFSKPSVSAAPVISDNARAFVRQTICDPKQPVIMFGFEWCEFCWSVRKMFAETGVSFLSIDVDGPDYRVADWGGDVLRALFEYTGQRTVPQVFVGGELVGGATEVLMAAGNGTLAERLRNLPEPIAFHPTEDPMAFLPSWVRRTKASSTPFSQRVL